MAVFFFVDNECRTSKLPELRCLKRTCLLCAVAEASGGARWSVARWPVARWPVARRLAGSRADLPSSRHGVTLLFAATSRDSAEVNSCSTRNCSMAVRPCNERGVGGVVTKTRRFRGLRTPFTLVGRG